MRWLWVLVVGLVVMAGCSGEDGGASSGGIAFAGAAGSPGGHGEFTDPVCQERSTNAAQAVGMAVSAADLSCDSAADCVRVSTDTDCHATCGAVVSETGAEDVARVIALQNETTCQDFVDERCTTIVPPCVPPLPVGCVAGRCMELSVNPGSPPRDDTTGNGDGDGDRDADGGVPDADGGRPAGDGDGDGAGQACIDDTLRFGSDGGFVAFVDRYSLAPCARFAVERTSFGQPGQLAGCENRVAADATVSALDIQRALDDFDVQSALADAPVLFGRDTRPVDGTVFRIELDGEVVELGWECMGAPGCTPIPAGLARLESLLQDLIAQQRAVAPCDAL